MPITANYIYNLHTCPWMIADNVFSICRNLSSFLFPLSVFLNACSR